MNKDIAAAGFPQKNAFYCIIKETHIVSGNRSSSPEQYSQYQVSHTSIPIRKPALSNSAEKSNYERALPYYCRPGNTADDQPSTYKRTRTNDQARIESFTC